MIMDIATRTQYAGLDYELVKKPHDAGKVNEETKEAIFQKRLEEESKKVQPVADARKKVIEHYIAEKDVKRRRIEHCEFGEYIDIKI